MVVTSVLGHLMEMKVPDSIEKNWYKTNPVDLYTCTISKQIKKEFSGIEKTLTQEARKADWLILWLDCDREGENIAHEVMSVCKKVNKRLKIFRAKFSTLLPNEIHSATTKLGTLNQLDSDAVDVRMELDLRIGFSFTRFQTLRLKAKFGDISGKQPISYGPCQFPTLGFVVDRYWQHKYFKKEDFWTIDVRVKRGNSVANFNWKRIRLFDKYCCVVLYEKMLEEESARVVKVETKPTRKFRPFPLTTVEFQKIASKNLHISAEEAMLAAEKLYQKGFISYPRTETDAFSDEFNFMELIKTQQPHAKWGNYANSLVNENKFKRPKNGKNNDQSHPPIYPTKFASKFDKPIEEKVYELITRHFLACCSEDALGNETKVEIQIGFEMFHCKGLHIVAYNYLDVYPYQKWSNTTIPEFKKDETFVPTEVSMRQSQTVPPALLTEPELIQLMNQNGIGTDATIATIIHTIIQRGYAVRQGSRREFKPTELGESLVAGYNYIGYRKLNQPQIRAKMEKDMNDISKGMKKKEEVLKENIELYKKIFESVVAKGSDLEKALSRYFKVVK